MRDDEGVRTVWAVIYPPSYQPPSAGEELVAEPLPLPLQARGQNWYGAIYGQFDEMGKYRIVVYAEDEGSLTSRPVVIEVNPGSRIFLPLVNK